MIIDAWLALERNGHQRRLLAGITRQYRITSLALHTGLHYNLGHACIVCTETDRPLQTNI